MSNNSTQRYLLKNKIWIALYRMGFDIRIEYKIPGISTVITGYEQKPFYPFLKRIYDFLLGQDKSINAKNTNRIGHTKTLPDCDVFLARTKQVVEIDEKQHLNTLRGKVLDMYPEKLPLAFDRDAYRKKCANSNPGIKPSSIWFEVIRDFLPWINGFYPTARIECDSLPLEFMDMDDKSKINYLLARDSKLKFFEEENLSASPMEKSSNVDEEKNLVYRYALDRFPNAYWGWSLEMPANLKGIKKEREVASDLKYIYSRIEAKRKQSFKTSDYLAPYDIFVPEEGIIIELDEIQHFTLLREVALNNYPKQLCTAYDRVGYLGFCKLLARKDADPPYRDEQRAWYDTIRDFSYRIDKALKPIIRIPLFFSDKVQLPMDRESIFQSVEDQLTQIQSH